jgi:hypothetical protein
MNASLPSSLRDKEDAPSISRMSLRLPEPFSQVMMTSYGRNHPLGEAHLIIATCMTSRRQIMMHMLLGIGGYTNLP